MKKIILLLTVTLLVYSICFATIRRVRYPGTFKANVDYATLQEAHDAASNNDTIQVYGDAISGTTISKPLVIIGFGYNFDVNSGLQAIGTDEPSKVYIGFGAGSNGSTVIGVGGTFIIGDQGGTHTPVSNISFQRCRGNFTFSNYEGWGPESNIKINSCVITGGGMQNSGVNDFNVTDLQINNCILVGQFNMYKPGSSIAITNCVSPIVGVGVYLTLNDASALIRNCILGYSNAAQNINTIYENNFFNEALPAGPIPGSNNRWGQDWAAIFTRNGAPIGDESMSYSEPIFDEDYYTLKAGSPAINGGFNAANQPTNCGIYGGEPAYVYKLSGVPGVPAIYQLTAPSLNASNNPYNVTISVRSNN